MPYAVEAICSDTCDAIMCIYDADFLAPQVIIESVKQVKSFEKYLADPPFTEKSMANEI